MPAPAARLLALLAITTPTAAWLGQIFRHRFLPRRNALEGVELRPRTIHIDPDWSIDVVEIAEGAWGLSCGVISTVLALGFYVLNELVRGLIDELVGLFSLRLAQRL